MAHSISAGLDYPGVGPEHSFLKSQGRAEYVAATDEIRGFIDLSDRPLLAAIIGQDSLEISTKVRPKEAWNLLIGGNWEITKRWSLMAEVGGVFDRFHVIGGATFRF